MIDQMDNLTLEIAKFIVGTITSTTIILIGVGERRKKDKIEAAKDRMRSERRVEEERKKIEDKMNLMDKQNAEDRATIREDVKRLREKVDQERIDFKERITEITEYMYKRPR
jgi:predicted alpha/beta superfamily hydrolase